MIKINHIIASFTFVFLLVSCKKSENEQLKESLIKNYPKDIKIPEGMIWVSGDVFTLGAKENDSMALPHEKPELTVAVDGFFIDATEVTNAQFKKFVDATSYVTTAERPVIWEEMKKSLPLGTPKPADSLLVPGSLVFYEGIKNVNNLNDYQQWWRWTPGANWKHPYGKNSTIEGKENYPVVHVTYQDAVAYCKWANRKLPTEAQWELAAKGKLENPIFTWGDNINLLSKNANTWNGNFPVQNTKEDGFVLMSPVKSYPANSLGIYDMAGNVWEITQDWYNIDYFQDLLNTGKIPKNPTGAKIANNPQNPYQQERIIKGGSFLCNASYCGSYRISAKMGMTDDSSSSHVGFRTIVTLDMLKNGGKLACCNFKKR